MSILTGAANPLDYLFKLSTQRKLPAPVFSQVVEEGPPHMKTFVWRCTFMQITAEGKGRSKKEAKTAAARAIKDSLNPELLPPEPGKRKSDPSSLMNMSPSTSSSSKKRKKTGSSFGSKKFISPPGNNFGSHHHPHPPYGGNPGFHGKMSVDDHYVITKHKSIYPKEEELESILKLVTIVEESLRSCSDDLATEAAKVSKGLPIVVSESTAEEDLITEEEKEEHRAIMGVARVGDLAKGLLLSSDNNVELVIMCKEIPSPVDLSRLVSLLRPKLTDISYTLDECREEGGFKVCYEASPTETVVATVTLTSSKLNPPEKEDKPTTTTEVNGNNSSTQEVKQDGGFLNLDRIQEALVELRRSNWFSGMAAGLPSCVECIRIIKEISRRDPSWTCLSTWLIELLVERSLYSAHSPLSPSSSLLRVLEVISSGIFLEGGSGLKDPCEKEDIDVSAYLTPQQREDLTHSAQYFIRLITYRQINKVLGMDKLPPKGSSRGYGKGPVKNGCSSSGSSAPVNVEEYSHENPPPLLPPSDLQAPQ